MRPVTVRKLPFLIPLLGVFLLASPSAFGGAHTWDVNEVYTNADGTIQFVELREANGTPGELGVDGQPMRSLNFPTHLLDLLHAIASPTSNKFLLGGTAAFAAMPGSPDLDFTIPDGFLRLGTAADSVTYGAPYDTLAVPSGAIPLDGVQSFNDGAVIADNTPTNYAGEVGFVDASPPPQPPGVPDGTGGSTPMLVTPLDLTGDTLSISWDTSVCTGDSEHHILYGDGSMFPTAPGNPFGLLGSVCAVGGTSPFVWNSVPAAADSTGILWWVIVVKAGASEGSWGTDSAGTERLGPGTSGSSGQCTVTSLSTTNVCGH